jgi:hypothetical protein
MRPSRASDAVTVDADEENRFKHEAPPQEFFDAVITDIPTHDAASRRRREPPT